MHGIREIRSQMANDGISNDGWDEYAAALGYAKRSKAL